MKNKAEEVLNYCIEWIMPHGEIIKFSKSKRYKEMKKEIEFILNTS